MVFSLQELPVVDVLQQFWCSLVEKKWLALLLMKKTQSRTGINRHYVAVVADLKALTNQNLFYYNWSWHIFYFLYVIWRTSPKAEESVGWCFSKQTNKQTKITLFIQIRIRKQLRIDLNATCYSCIKLEAYCFLQHMNMLLTVCFKSVLNIMLSFIYKDVLFVNSIL